MLISQTSPKCTYPTVLTFSCLFSIQSSAFTCRYGPFFITDHFKFRYLNEMSILMRWWILLYVSRITVGTYCLSIVSLVKMEKWECRLLLASFLCLHVQKTICRRICFDNELWTKFSGHQNIRELGIQEVERPENGSLISEQEGLILKHGKFPLSSN